MFEMNKIKTLINSYKQRQKIYHKEFNLGIVGCKFSGLSKYPNTPIIFKGIKQLNS